jgi:hypothetical protein
LLPRRNRSRQCAYPDEEQGYLGPGWHAPSRARTPPADQLRAAVVAPSWCPAVVLGFRTATTFLTCSL